MTPLNGIRIPRRTPGASTSTTCCISHIKQQSLHANFFFMDCRAGFYSLNLKWWKREFKIVFFFFCFFSLWEIHMMLNACVYIDIWSNASSIYLLWQMQNQQKAHIQRNFKKKKEKKRSNNLLCWITSDHVLHVKEEKTRNVCSCKNIAAQTCADQTVLISLLCVLVSDARLLLILSWCSVCISSYHFCILRKRWNFWVCASDWWPFQLFNHSSVFSFCFFLPRQTF